MYAGKSLLVLLSIGMSLILSGCTNSTLVKTTDLSSSSVAYTESVNELLDETIGHVIDVDSKELLRARNGKHRAKKLKERNQSLKVLIAEINEFRYQTTLMNNYFLHLQALADSTVKDDLGVNVGRISGRINYMNNRPKDANDEARISRLLTEEDEGYISKIGSMLVGSFYAARIESALSRDAPIIGKQMLLQEKQLVHILDIFKDRLDAESRMHLTDKVVAPYVNPDIGEMELDKETWVSNRRNWFELQQARSIFNDVKEAHKALRLAWEDILRGKKDIGAVDIMLADVNDFLSTIHALDQSRSKKNQFNSHIIGE